MTDAINPAHYRAGRRFEVIEVLEDWAQFAPNVKQGIALAQALKYLGRLYCKGEPEENLRKAQWYLDRLGQHLIDDAPEIPFDPYEHPDTVRFERSVGLEGGISDEDIRDLRDYTFTFDVE